MTSQSRGQQSLMHYIAVVLILLAIDAAVNLALTSSMVAFLHKGGQGPFEVAYPAGSTFQLAGHPANLLVNQGHTTNGANGTALILVGFGGVIAMSLEHRSRKHGKSSPFFYFWGLITILSWLLTLTALIYTFVVTAQTSNQTIDLAVALANKAPARYPNDEWTPENWFLAVLNLPLVSDDNRHLINKKVELMRGWRYNLIPMFVLGFVLMDLVVWEILRTRKGRGMYGKAATVEQKA